MTKHSVTLKKTASAYHSTLAFVLGAVVMLPLHSQAQEAMVLGDTGNVVIGLDNPERQLHLRGSNATFRMDRNPDTAAFIFVTYTPPQIQR